MNKSTFFTGQPIFTQLVKLLPRDIIIKAVRQYDSDHYYKKFDTYHHLITMLYASYQHCTSLREVVTGMAACEGRLQSLGIQHLPARSTLSEANISRDYKVFEQIYLYLYGRLRHLLPDSRKRKASKELVIIDSTTISLFKEILKAAGNKRLDGKRKGGIKVHMAMQAHEDVPFLIQFTSGAAADVSFLKQVHLPAGSVVVMDKGYCSFAKFNEWTRQKVNWVTRLKNNSIYTVLYEKPLSGAQKKLNVISDQVIMLGFLKKKEQVKCRLVRYYDAEMKREFAFITNNFRWAPSRVADIYAQRWQIEQLFRRLKQNMPLQYFLGDNENAIKVQIFCALIADLLLKVAMAGVKRKWAFSNLASLVRLHLMNYTHLQKFLESPDKATIINSKPPESPQLKLNLTG